MSKQQRNDQTSPFDALKIARLRPTNTSPAESSSELITPNPPPPSRHLAGQMSKHLAKSIDPHYIKFTIYVRKPTHLAVKTALVAQEREMSDLVEELLQQWLKQRTVSGELEIIPRSTAEISPSR